MNFAWVLLIIFIPILGAMVFLMRHPRKRKNS
jgi:preprotein translocase subunit YajC